MDIPKIKTTRGLLPVTKLPNSALIEGFLSCCTNSEDIALVHLLSIAEHNSESAAKILRRCLTSGRSLVAYYPGLGGVEPKKATLIGSIPDGALYLV